MARRPGTDLPQPPPFQRRITIAPVQAVGVTVLLAIAVAALTGVLGLRPGQTRAANGDLEVQVSYPQILRYGTSLPLTIDIRNAGRGTMNRIDVRIDRVYLDAFEEVRFTPEAREVDGRDARVSLGELPAGESRTIVAWLEAHERGRQPARLKVAAAGQPALEMKWTTTVLP